MTAKEAWWDEKRRLLRLASWCPRELVAIILAVHRRAP